MATTKTLKGKVSCKLLNFRAEPVMNEDNVLFILKEGDSVRIVGDTDEKFYKVRFTTPTKRVAVGYVMKEYIEIENGDQ